jgi:hypothetical protein
MTAAPRRGLIIRDSFFHGDQSQDIDPAEIEAERVHLSAITGWDIRYLQYDKLAIEDPMYCHLRFLEEIKALKPAFIWYHPALFSYLIHRNIRSEILHAARALYGARLVFSFGDLAYRYLTAYAAGYAAIGDVSVSWDGNGSLLQEMVPGKTVLDFAAPRDGRIFRDRKIERDVDVCFIGQVHRYPDRRDMLAALQARGVSVTVQGGEQGFYLSWEGYADLLNRSKIVLNFSRTKDGVHQIKGRVIETLLCGALLLESENNVTSRYLEPYRHYVPFGDADDLARKIRHYLADDVARRAIADAGRAHVEANLSERIWWRSVLDALERSKLDARAQQ